MDAVVKNQKEKIYLNIKSFALAYLFMAVTGCASSDLSRNAANQIDGTYQHSSQTVRNLGSGDTADAYQNAKQTTKGVLLGGATGAVAGGLTSGIGLLPGAAGGAVFGGILGAYIDSHTSLVDQLENRGAKLIILGDQVLIILPSARLFQGITSKLKYQAHSTLDLVAQIINGFTNMSVKVAAYTNSSVFPQEVNRALSQQQADAVVKYLWPSVSTRLLTAAGYGGSNLVEANSATWDSGENYRIEITLEKLPD